MNSIKTRVIRFKNDTRLRAKLFVPEAMQHPAKGHCGMWQQIIEEVSKPGDVVLDPMAGIGTTLLAARMGRNVICIEKESHFVEPMRASWAKMQTFGPEMGCEKMGQVTIIQGDARNLEGLMADCVVTSPPYEKSDIRHGVVEGTHARQTVRREPSHFQGYTRPQAILTSPPYEGSLDDVRDRAHSIDGSKSSDWHRGPYSQINQPQHYGTAENIGNMRGESYWDAMRLVYEQCHKILADNGVLVLITKGFTRSGIYQNLPLQTQELVESLGFVKQDEWLRELWSLSFWRTLQKKNSPQSWDDRLRYEVVQVYRRSGTA